MKPKFCRDCKHAYTNENFAHGIFYCSQPASTSWDFVTGNPSGTPCSMLRPRHDLCGPDAKFFEPKEANEPTDR